MLIYINFSFDFLGLDKVYFINYFANELVYNKMSRFLSPCSRFLSTCSRVLSDIKRSAAPRVLYLIKYSYTRALNST
jgi:hypothetical protein